MHSSAYVGVARTFSVKQELTKIVCYPCRKQMSKIKKINIR